MTEAPNKKLYLSIVEDIDKLMMVGYVNSNEPLQAPKNPLRKRKLPKSLTINSDESSQ